MRSYCLSSVLVLILHVFICKISTVASNPVPKPTPVPNGQCGDTTCPSHCECQWQCRHPEGCKYYCNCDDSEIGDTVFVDVNGNGMLDDSDYGISGVTLELLDSDRNVVRTTMTDVNGYYLFWNLSAGDYCVKVLSNGQLNGLTPTGPARSESCTSVDGRRINSDYDQDFGYKPHGPSPQPQSNPTPSPTLPCCPSDPQGNWYYHCRPCPTPTPPTPPSHPTPLPCCPPNTQGLVNYQCRLCPVPTAPYGKRGGGKRGPTPYYPAPHAPYYPAPHAPYYPAPFAPWSGKGKGSAPYSAPTAPYYSGKRGPSAPYYGKRGKRGPYPAPLPCCPCYKKHSWSAPWHAPSAPYYSGKRGAPWPYSAPSAPYSGGKRGPFPSGKRGPVCRPAPGPGCPCNECNSNIGDVVFIDRDCDGNQDGGDSGVSGVRVELLDGNTNNVIEATTTDYYGYYLFSNLCRGRYCVRITNINSVLGPGATPTGPAVSVSCTYVDGFNYGSDFDQDFGYCLPTPEPTPPPPTPSCSETCPPHCQCKWQCKWPEGCKHYCICDQPHGGKGYNGKGGYMYGKGGGYYGKGGKGYYGKGYYNRGHYYGKRGLIENNEE